MLQPPAANEFVRAQLDRWGWCPFDIENFVSRFSAPTAFYLMLLPRFYRENNTRNPCGRDSCTSKRCATNFIDTRNYQTQHDIGCDHAGAAPPRHAGYCRERRHTDSESRAEPAEKAAESGALTMISHWMRRSWTLLEASLARKLIVHFLGGSISISADAIRNLDPAKCSMKLTDPKTKRGLPEIREKDIVIRELSSMYWDMPFAGRTSPPLSYIWNYERNMEQGTGPIYQPRLYQFCLVWNSLVSRVTSDAKDKIIIFGVLLDFSAQELLALDLNPDGSRTPGAPEATKAIFHKQTYLPVGILSDYSERFVGADDESNRWIPRVIEGPKLNYADGAMIQRNSALELPEVWAYFLPAGSPRMQTFALRDEESGQRFKVSMKESAADRSLSLESYGTSDSILIFRQNIKRIFMEGGHNRSAFRRCGGSGRDG
ncbi:hypothetical protein BP6252_13215 [Coleophoma cylindrospora]|uniref:Heterokaryon incompatibility domain-containing protein n=1 Tax=Coleophoma cylindrospora TaxID=1849047 RepID=A0A3D8QAB8_9HELO|nr:hypothetical protein BP6252_13215 [Coleophoma cylindrospora]